MTVHEEELLRRIRELEKKNGYLNQQLKEHRYGLTWIDVPEAFEKASENKIPVLEEVKEKSFTDGSEKPTHILIEGDNYHALTCLQYTHKGKIDVIYIDPPYNTGSDGFTYKDKRLLTQYPDGTPVPKDHPLRHSYWLSFMHKRLELAKNLLSDDGVIFISINEEEYAQLKLLCDSIFKENNYITTITIKVRHEDRILKGDKPIHETTELLLMYQKSSSFRIQKRTKDNSKPTGYKYRITELTNNPKIIELGGKNVSVFYPREYKIEECEESFDNLKKINIRGSIKAGNSSGRFHMAYLEDRRNDFDVLYKVPDIGEDGLGYRYFLSRKDSRQANGSYFQGSPLSRQDLKEIPYPNFYDFEPEFNTVGQEGGVPFGGGKKPIAFIEQLLKIYTNRSSFTVLDFFAGSGSTGHCILDMNSSGGNRRFILVQTPELTYEIKNGKKVPKKGAIDVFVAGYERIVDVTYQRCKNVMQGYTNSKGKKIDGLGGSLKYYKTAFTGTGNPHRNPIMLPSDEDRISLAQNAGVLVSLAENTLYEIVKKDCYQIFTNNHGRFAAVYLQEDLKQFEDFKQGIEKLGGNVTVYIFSWGNNPDAANAFMHLSNVEVKSYPNAILDAYKSAMQQIESQK